MELGKWSMSVGAVFVILFLAGMIISLLSSQLQCSKISGSTSATEGAKWGTYGTLVYALASYFDRVRNPFSTTLFGFGLPLETSEVIGVGYLVMLISWVATVWTVHNTEQAVCNPDVNEMTAFKTKLMAELQTKQEQAEANATSGPNPQVTVTSPPS
jgi:hypothetical protein